MGECEEWEKVRVGRSGSEEKGRMERVREERVGDSEERESVEVRR